MAGGRPTIYSDELAAEICAEIALGNSLASIVRRDDMPAMTTVYRWLSENSAFRELYTRAREDQADTMADIMTDIADTATADTVQQARLRIDTRKWIASKLKPKKYGDKVQQEITGEAGGPVAFVIRDMTKEGGK